MNRIPLWSRRTVVAALTFLVTAGLQGTPDAQAQTFSDTAGSPFGQAIDFLNSQNIMTGHGDGLFHGDWDLERAQMLVVFFRMTGIPINEPTEPCFLDVPIGLWFSGPVCTAKNLGLVQGFEDGNFYPGRPVDVAETLAMAEKFFGWDLASAADEPLPPHIPEDAWFAPLIRYVKKHNLLPPEVLGMQPYQAMKRDATAETAFRTTVAHDQGDQGFDDSTAQIFLEEVQHRPGYIVSDSFMETSQTGLLRGAAPTPVLGAGEEPPDAGQPTVTGSDDDAGLVHEESGFRITVDHPASVSAGEAFFFQVGVSAPETSTDWKISQVTMDPGFIQNLKNNNDLSVADHESGFASADGTGLLEEHETSYKTQCLQGGQSTLAKLVVTLEFPDQRDTSGRTPQQTFILRPIQLECLGGTAVGTTESSAESSTDNGSGTQVEAGQTIVNDGTSVTGTEAVQTEEPVSRNAIVAEKTATASPSCVSPGGEAKILATWKMIDQIAGNEVTERYAATVHIVTPGGDEYDTTIKSRRGGSRVSELELSATATTPGTYTFSFTDVGFATDQYQPADGVILTVYDLESNPPSGDVQREPAPYVYNGDEALLTLNIPDCGSQEAGTTISLFDGFGQYNEAGNTVIARWFLKSGDAPMGNANITVTSQIAGQSPQTHQLTTDSSGLAMLQLFSPEPGQSYVFRLTHVEGNAFDTADANEAAFQEFTVNVPEEADPIPDS